MSGVTGLVLGAGDRRSGSDWLLQLLHYKHRVSTEHLGSYDKQKETKDGNLKTVGVVVMSLQIWFIYIKWYIPKVVFQLDNPISLYIF